MKFNILIALCHPILLVPGVINKALLKLRFDHSFTSEIDISLAHGKINDSVAKELRREFENAARHLYDRECYDEAIDSLYNIKDICNRERIEVPPEVILGIGVAHNRSVKATFFMSRKKKERLNKADHYLKKALHSNKDNPAFLLAVVVNLLKTKEIKDLDPFISEIKKTRRLGVLNNYIGGDNPEVAIYTLEGVRHFIDKDFIASFKAFEEALSKPNTLGYRRDRSEYGLKMARICKRFRCWEFINIVILSFIPLSKKAVLDFIKRRLEE